MAYNIMTCGGFDTGFMGGCSMAYVVLGVLVFVVLISRRQVAEYLDMEYNLIGGFVGALIPYLILITLFGTMKWSLLAGIGGSLVGGLFSGVIFGESSGGYE